jgi:starch phosphorylase
VCLSLSHAESYEGGRHRFEGDVKLERTGPFGYTVRICPSHPLLANAAELGLSRSRRSTRRRTPTL